MLTVVPFLVVLLAELATGQAPPQNVTISSTATDRNKWVHGVVSVSWTPPSGSSVLGYNVSIAPLAYMETFEPVAGTGLTATAATTLKDYLLLPGKATNAIGIVGGALQLDYDNSSWANASMGLMASPAAVRRLPESISTAPGIAYMTVDVDCGTAAAVTTGTVQCGIVVYNAGTGLPLLFWGLRRVGSAGAWAVVLDTQAAGSTVWTTANAANAAWTAAATTLYIERRVPTDTANPFLVAARLKSDTTPWASVRARTVVTTTTLDAFSPGALWFGVSAKAVPAPAPAATSPLYRSASPVRGSARFDNLLVAMTLPSTLPKDVYGLTDVCVTPGVTAPRAVWVKVVNASAVLSGLSANFPYTVTVQALLNGNLASAASAPIEGLYFWARRMPPRQQRLVMWLDAKWMPAGAVGTWPDASGNGHHAINTAATAQRPVTVHANTGYGYDFITPGAVTFTRASAQYLVSDADGVHLGGAGPMTVYWFARNRYTSSQLLVGRGAIANRLDTASSGWAAAISSTSWDTSGFLSFRHGAPAVGSGNTGAAVAVAASQVRASTPIYNGAPSMSSHIGTLTPVMLANGSSAGPNADALALARAGQLPADYNATAMPRLGAMGLFRAVACNAPNCSTGSEAVFLDELRPLFNNTYSSDPYAVTYAALGTNANLQPTPAIGTDLNLRIGGQPYTINTATAYQGDLLGLLIYNEVHDSSTRSAVTSYYANMYESTFCPLNILSPGLLAPYNTYDSCRVGTAFQNCYQDCSATYDRGYYFAFLGSVRDHYCVNGNWNYPPLVCKRQCLDVLAPLYYDTCWRRFIDERFNATAEPWFEAKHWVWPALPLYERLRIWVANATLGGIMVANTRTVDACERVRSQWLLYGPHNLRWNSFAPPNNLLPTWTRADLLLEDDASSAGVAVRVVDNNNHYRAEFTTQNVTLVRWMSSRLVIGTVKLNATTLRAGTWANVGIRAQDKLIEVSIGDRVVLAVTEGANYIQWGPGALWINAASAARFDNFTVDVGCDLGGAGRYMFEGMTLLMQCKPGYTTMGNTSWTCADSVGQYNGSYLICKSQPPIPQPAVIRLLERTPNNTFVGNTIALPANADQVISYEIAGQSPSPANGTMAFSVSGCSGSVRVNDPTQLDNNRNPNFTLTVFAWPDTQRISGVYSNQTVSLINIPDAPSLVDGIVYDVPEGGCGPAFWNVSLPLSNPDGYKLAFSLPSGNADGMWAVNASTGLLYVSCAVKRCPAPIASADCPPGLNWAFSSYYSLLVAVVTPEGLGSTANVYVNVLDLNTAPIVPSGGNLYQLQETLVAPGTLLGGLLAFDTDRFDPSVPANWSALTFQMLANANWTSPLNPAVVLPNLLNLTADGTLSLSSTAVPDAGLPYGDYIWFERRLVRGVLRASFQVSDGARPALSGYGSVSIVITAANSTDDWPTITDIQLPQGGLLTQGGQLILLTGSSMPAGKSMDLRYYTPDGILRVAEGCAVASDTTASCRSTPGFGYALSLNITMGGRLPNYTIPLEVSYAAPRVDAVLITDPAYTTAGTATNGLAIIGNCFGPPGTPITVKIGAAGEFDAVVTQAGHTVINATLGPGCGVNLPVTVIVGGQNNSLAWLDASGTTSAASSAAAAAASLSYPRGSLDMVYVPPNAGYTLDALSTLSPQYLRLRGRNLGPAFIRRQPRTLSVGYRDASGTYAYSMQCTPLAASPHTDAECMTMPGVGSGLVFVADVCGQPSRPSVFNASYARPVLTDITGPGAFRGSTAGGQQVFIWGSEFGPAQRPGDVPSSVTAVLYAKPVSGAVTFTAAECFVAVASTVPGASQITCLTAPGTGAGHGWTAVVGRQPSNVLSKGTGYSPPIVNYFSGGGAADADTAGSQVVTVNGQNFGAWPELISVQYGNKLLTPRVSDGQLPTSPGQEAGVVQYTPAACTLSIAHFALDCALAPGAGESLVWKIAVDGQASTAPTTSFARPAITDVSFSDPSVSFASGDGGDEVTVTGSGFGLDFLQQSVTYGPMGSEYAVQSWTYVSHSELRAVLVPGVGANLSFVVRVADQASTPFASGVSYVLPRITTTAPTRGGTAADPARPTIITVGGFDFGLINPAVEVEVAFGNDADSSVMRLPVTARSPSLAEVTDPTWTPAEVPTPQSVSFALPEGLGANRTVRLVQYLRGTPASAAQVRLTAPQASAPGAGLFSYDAPELVYINVRSIVDEATCAAMQAAAAAAAATAGVPFIPSTLAQPATAGAAGGDGPVSVNCSSSRMLIITGLNMGPPQATHNDGIQRLLQYVDPAANVTAAAATPLDWLPWPAGWRAMPEFAGGAARGGPPAADALPRVTIANHSHTRLVAFSTVSSGTLRLSIVSNAWTGEALIQTSNMLTFAETSPAVSAVLGQPPDGFRAEGWENALAAGLAPQTIAVRVSQLLQFTALYIVVGDGVTAARCPIVESSATASRAGIVPDTDVYTRLVRPVTAGGGAAVTLTCMVPEGQGRLQRVVVVRDQSSSNADLTLDYAVPVITGIGGVPLSTGADTAAAAGTGSSRLLQAAAGVAGVAPFPGTAAVTVPTTKGRIRFQATNAGPCPTLRVANGQGPSFIPACSLQPDPATGRQRRVMNPDVSVLYHPGSRSYVIDFNVTDGEGTGVAPYNPLGWTLVLESGNQDSTSTGGVVLLRYRAPTVAAISPGSGPTAGSTPSAPLYLTINGSDFGTGLAAGVSITLVSPLRVGTLPCAPVRYFSHSRLQCALPPGTGYFFRARVQVADQSGVGGAFNYSAPLVSRITLLAPGAVMSSAAAAAAGLTSLDAQGSSVSAPVPASLMTPALWAQLAVTGPLSAALASIAPAAGAAAGAAPAATGAAAAQDARSGRSLLQWPTSGGPIVVVDGANFGGGGSADDCAVVSPREAVPSGGPSSGGAALATSSSSDPLASAAPVLCNGFADFLGEGEVPASAVLYWNHTRVAFTLPPGAGYRTITVAPGGQPPLPSSGVPPTRYNLRYADPALPLPLLRSGGRVSTDGGDEVQLLGLSLPYPPLALVPEAGASAAAAAGANGTGGSGFPLPLPPRLWTMLPTENVRLSFNNQSLGGSCLGNPASAGAAAGVVAPGFEGCHLGRISEQQPAGAPGNLFTNPSYRRVKLAELRTTAAAAASSVSGGDATSPGPSDYSSYIAFLEAFSPNASFGAPLDVISFRTPPGVGVNKSLVLEVLDPAGNVVAASAPVLFSYDAPVITQVETEGNARIILDDGQGGQSIRILGRNMGRYRDAANYTEAERLLEVSIGGWLSVNASRQQALSGSSAGVTTLDYIGFRMPPAAPVGFSEVQVQVAGQRAVSTPRSSASLFVGCKPGYFGHSNESCAACPIGALCVGLGGPMRILPSGQTELSSIAFASPDPVPHPFLLDPADPSQPLDMRRLANSSVMVGNLEVDLLGYHTYPLPLPGFFDLNATMGSACPPLVRSYFPSRDVCVVACIPPDACTGGNHCQDAYRSKAPYYRCADCNLGYFKSAGDCIKCPDSPYMLFVGAAMVILVVAVVGYLLNKYQFDIRVVSIGIDYFQVLAIFSNAKVAWPPVIKQLYRMLSAFNLNIEIVAPECLIPDVSFANKYFVILALPFAVVLGFLALNSARFLFFRYVYGQRNWRDHLRTMASSISILLLLMFLLYLYVTRTILSVFQCVSATPDDGKTYMGEVFEECWKPGGMQLMLVPWSVAGILVMVVGYPVAVLLVLSRNREAAMEDQLLRALDISPPKGSWLITLRAMMGRTYNQFKPQFFFWIFFIITRKFFIAFSGLMFSRNPAFQMAFCLLVLFLAYALQVRYRPYMPASEFEEVLDDAAARAKHSPLFAILRARIIGVEAATRKKRSNKNNLFASGDDGEAPFTAERVASGLVTFLTNFNVVESFLLFSASMVSLLGVMYTALSAAVAGPTGETYAETARSSVTALLMTLIVLSIIYYVSVLLLDLTAQYQARRVAAYQASAELRRKRADAEARAKGGRGSATGARPISMGMTAMAAGGGRSSLRPRPRSARVDRFRDQAELAAEKTLTNPLFMKLQAAEAEGAEGGSLAKTISAQVEPPTPALWEVFRGQFGSMAEQMGGLTAEAELVRAREARMVAALAAAGRMTPQGEWVDLSKQAASSTSSGGAGAGGVVMMSNALATRRAAGAEGGKRTYKPLSAPAGSQGDGKAGASATRGRVGIVPASAALPTRPAAAAQGTDFPSVVGGGFAGSSSPRSGGGGGSAVASAASASAGADWAAHLSSFKVRRAFGAGVGSSARGLRLGAAARAPAAVGGGTHSAGVIIVETDEAEPPASGTGTEAYQPSHYASVAESPYVLGALEPSPGDGAAYAPAYADYASPQGYQ